MTILKWGMAVALLSAFELNAQSLKDYQWKNRILLLFDDSRKSDTLKRQLEKFSKTQKEMIDRDLILFIVADKDVFTQNGHVQGMSLKDVYDTAGVSKKFKGILLIGKDGGAKLKEEFLIHPQLVFDLIDGMPMRKAEMRAAKKH
ncbi:DUF4174 domain-containing protein [Ulvibacterium sp.]|uniref:DUF4174 domain-containing protein n=1 Tax=Ulvibacterium sp. TaxID=2665914 RepID=UPI002632E524|nr:DUF4174 domain-containing protein [Ulvibacterium sp.]